MQKAISKYLSDNHPLVKDHSSARVFVVIGHYNDLREELRRREWIEHDHKSTGALVESEKFKSNAFHFLYSTKAKDCFRIPNLGPS